MKTFAPSLPCRTNHPCLGVGTDALTTLPLTSIEHASSPHHHPGSRHLTYPGILQAQTWSVFIVLCLGCPPKMMLSLSHQLVEPLERTLLGSEVMEHLWCQTWLGTWFSYKLCQPDETI